MYSKEYYQNNKNRYKDYYQNNKELFKEYYLKNKKYKNAYSREYWKTYKRKDQQNRPSIRQLLEQYNKTIYYSPPQLRVTF